MMKLILNLQNFYTEKNGSNKFLKKNYNFKGKNILITGANGNIGFKLAKFFYNSGAKFNFNR